MSACRRSLEMCGESIDSMVAPTDLNSCAIGHSGKALRSGTLTKNEREVSLPNQNGGTAVGNAQTLMEILGAKAARDLASCGL